jgi:hypothetical protein
MDEEASDRGTGTGSPKNAFYAPDDSTVTPGWLPEQGCRIGKRFEEVAGPTVLACIYLCEGVSALTGSAAISTARSAASTRHDWSDLDESE